MLISTAYAASEAVAQDIPSAGETFAMNMGVVFVIVILAYILMVRPQQQRFKEHADMLRNLDKGEKVVTQGGLVGKIVKIVDEHEVRIDVGDGTKVNILRSAISSKYEDAIAATPAVSKEKKEDTKTEKDDKKSQKADTEKEEKK